MNLNKIPFLILIVLCFSGHLLLGQNTYKATNEGWMTNLDEAYAELVAKGIKIKTEPRNFKDVRICFFYDPDGNSLELVQELG